MIIIGLTGGIASGKSKVSRLLENLGACIIDADLIARDIVKPGELAWKKIVSTFGEEYLAADKTINRTKLGTLVFNDPEALQKLNNITHPQIIDLTKKLLESYQEAGEKVAVIDAALLIETGMHKLVNQVWVVSVEHKIQLQRLMKRDNINEQESLKKINVQTKAEERLKWADLIIENNGTVEELETKVIKAWKGLNND